MSLEIRDVWIFRGLTGSQRTPGFGASQIQFLCLLRLSILLARKVIFQNLCVILFCYMYLFINELFLKKNYDNDLGVDIFGASDIHSGCSSDLPLVLRNGDDDV